MRDYSGVASNLVCVAIGVLMLDFGSSVGAQALQADSVAHEPIPSQLVKPIRTPKSEATKRQFNANTVTMIASSGSSTHTRFVEDIQNVIDDGRPHGVRILPLLGRGGGQNFRDLLFLRDIDMGTTDAEYLRYFKQKDQLLCKNADKHIEYITKLFNAEFHVLAPRSIKSWSDLNGTKVNFFRPANVTAIAAETIFRTLNINVEPTFFDNELAIEKLRRGEIAAVVRLTGAPDRDFASIRPEEDFHLVPLQEQSVMPKQYAELTNIYFPARLTHEQYPQLIAEGDEVPTVAGSILLAVYAWPENNERYKRIAKFVQTFFDNIEKFHDTSRHPKWREINLAADVPGWTRFKAAKDWLAAHDR
jgi:TRAP-type uncharacterized transport system substrate-binding protein